MEIKFSFKLPPALFIKYGIYDSDAAFVSESVDVMVSCCELAIESDDPMECRFNSTCEYSVNIYNTGNADCELSILSDEIDDECSYVPGDFIIASDTAKFTLAYSRIGFSPDGSSSYFLPRIIGTRRYTELILTNRVLSANEALDWGLINKVVDFKSKLYKFKYSILNFPAIMIRQAHERPEGMDEGTLIMSGLKKKDVITAIDVVTKQYAENSECTKIIRDYDIDNVSTKVVRIIMSYTNYIKRTVWHT